MCVDGASCETVSFVDMALYHIASCVSRYFRDCFWLGSVSCGVKSPWENLLGVWKLFGGARSVLCAESYLSLHLVCVRLSTYLDSVDVLDSTAVVVYDSYLSVFPAVAFVKMESAANVSFLSVVASVSVLV